jgi:hypothetical protein
MDFISLKVTVQHERLLSSVLNDQPLILFIKFNEDSLSVLAAGKFYLLYLIKSIEGYAEHFFALRTFDFDDSLGHGLTSA